MKPKDEASAAGTMSIIGLIPIDTEVIAISGIMIEAIAVLETTSLRKVIKRTIRKMITNSGSTARRMNEWAMSLGKTALYDPLGKTDASPEQDKDPPGYRFCRFPVKGKGPFLCIRGEHKQDQGTADGNGGIGDTRDPGGNPGDHKGSDHLGCPENPQERNGKEYQECPFLRGGERTEFLQPRPRSCPCSPISLPAYAGW